MDKKVRAHRRASSSSATSTSSASSLTSSSSSSSSFDTRRASGGRVRSGGSYKDPARSKKSRPCKYLGAGDRVKQKKAKSSQSLTRKHMSSKSSSRKVIHGHSSRKEFKGMSRDHLLKESPSSKDYGRSYNKSRSPMHQHRRSGPSKKSLSPGKRCFSPVGRKGRKRSPSLHKKTLRSISPRERSEYHQTLSPSRPRDPRIERAMKRSPELPARDARISRYERDLYEERRRDDRETRDGREKKLLKDRISFKDRFIAPDRESSRDEGRFSRDAGYAGGRSYEVEREFYSRVESRESSLERKQYDDPYERFERERNRIENRNRYEELSHERMASGGDYPVVPMVVDRRRPLPIDNRYVDDRRKMSHDMWPDDPRSAAASSSLMDRVPEPADSRAYSHHRRSGDWAVDGQGRRMHEGGAGWEKQSPHKRRGSDWAEDYPNQEWRDRPREWESQMDDHSADWHPRQRYQNNWNESERGDWGGNARKRGGVKSPNLPPPPPSQPLAPKRELSLPVSESTVSVPILEDDSFAKRADIKPFSPVSPSKAQLDEVKLSPMIAEEKVETIPLAGQPSIEPENFSDFSDDGDDILNQEPVNVPEKTIEVTNGEENKLIQGDATSYDEVLEEDGMDLEEISDDDLEDEKQAKYSVANALDIDWSTLTVDPNQQPAPPQTSALKRFSTLNILSRLGVSSRYAGKQFLDDLIDKCYSMELDVIGKKKISSPDLQPTSDEMTPAYEPNEVIIKQEEGEVDVEFEEIAIKPEVEENGMKKENEEERETTNSGVPDATESVADDLPQILPVVVADGVLKHVRHSKLSRSRVFYLGRKALCSQDDIIIRRRLCNLPEDEMIFEKPQFNKELFITAVNLLKI